MTSNVDFEKFKCHNCKKYLSVSPIYIYRYNNEEQNLCGRCDVAQLNQCRISKTRNLAFEQLAAYLEFPCINSPSCKEKLAWGKAKLHELICDYQDVKCIICNTMYKALNTVDHFQQYHKDEVRLSTKMGSSIKFDIKRLPTPNSPKKTFLAARPENLYLVSVSLKHSNDRAVLWGVPSCNCRMPYLQQNLNSNFTILSVEVKPLKSFKAEKFSMTFKNSREKLQKYWLISMPPEPKTNPQTKQNVLEYEFDLSHIEKRHKKTVDALEFEIYNTTEVEIEDDEASGPATTLLGADVIKASELLRDVSTSLECPVCLTAMAGNIFVCISGHSVCEQCRGNVNRCPQCRSSFSGTRNYVLEDIATKMRNFEH